jgi:hypothetical protein
VSDVKETLIKAKSLIEHGWCQGTGARNAQGGMANPTNHDATSWCMLGALDAVTATAPRSNNYRRKLYLQAHDMIYKVLGGDIADFNDEPTRLPSEVLAVFDKAIAACPK